MWQYISFFYKSPNNIFNHLQNFTHLQETGEENVPKGVGLRKGPLEYCFFFQLLYSYSHPTEIRHFILPVRYSGDSIDFSVQFKTWDVFRVFGQIKSPILTVYPVTFVPVSICVCVYPSVPHHALHPDHWVILWPEKLIIPPCLCCYFSHWGPAGLGVCVCVRACLEGAPLSALSLSHRAVRVG